MLESPFPVRAYRSTLHVVPVTDTGLAFTEWYARYDVDTDAAVEDEARLLRTFERGVFATGLAALCERFA
jgi:hypothetical protein